ncbi:MAG: hypothetical protein HYZ14_00625 [Bacteroidetes bacterium]|nr:hypothetical protein [Bacteroidota bacterium]
MRLLLIIPAVIFFSTWSLGQKPTCDCRSYMTGSFYTLGPDNGSKDTLFIYRTLTEQTETVGTDYKKKNEVFWLSPCKYLLRDKDLKTKKKRHPSDVIVKIIETGDGYYVVQAWAPHQKKLTMTIYVNN